MLQITPWERSALQLLAEGTPAAQLPTYLGIAECEIEARLAALFSRMGARTRADAIKAAARRGLIQSDQTGSSAAHRGSPTTIQLPVDPGWSRSTKEQEATHEEGH